MKFFIHTLNLIRAAFSADHYYMALNNSLKSIGNEYTMLHYPYHINDLDSVLQAQKNLTDHCIMGWGDIKGKSIIEIGCGNGVQLMYIKKKYQTGDSVGIDLNPANIEIANHLVKERKLTEIKFLIDNAQELANIKDATVDLVLNIESAFHYPDKQAFFNQIFRVLKPGGSFIVADLLTLRDKGTGIRRIWKHGLILHHWNEKKYIQGFSEANLIVNNTDDITLPVIKGFLNYPRWLKDLPRNGFKDSTYRLFFRIILRLFIFLLRKRRKYLVFSGNKAS